jgi:3-hydroxymyristoyl/3-hydroxydecanoyl-(acyl carrier protein) dehydratase
MGNAVSNDLQWTVAADHPVFAGHFPGTPLVPGVMLLDAVLQHIAADSGCALEPCEISAVKFLSPARPGEALTIRHSRAAGGALHFDVAAGARKIASGSIVPRAPRMPL